MATKRDINRFEKMTNAEKRVAICKDVVLQLNLGIYKAKSTYFESYDDIWDDEGMITHESIRGKTCSLCAKGALFVSRYSKFNDLRNFGSKREIEDWARDLGTKLQEFPQKMADDIEHAFEQNLGEIDEVNRYMNTLNFTEEDEFWEHITAWDGYPAEDRLRIICHNIIRNKGKFKPLELLDYEVTT